MKLFWAVLSQESLSGIIANAASVSVAGRPGRSLHTLVSLRLFPLNLRSKISSSIAAHAVSDDMKIERPRRW
jgi:hypothetical protein